MEVPIKFFLLTIGTTCDTLKPKRRFDAKPNHRYLWDTPTTCHFSIKKNNNDKKKKKKIHRGLPQHLLVICNKTKFRLESFIAFGRSIL